MPVVVGCVLGQDALLVPSAGDEEPVEAHATDGADPSLGVGVGVDSRRLRRSLDDFDVLGGEHGVEAGGDRGVVVADRNRNVAARRSR